MTPDSARYVAAYLLHRRLLRDRQAATARLFAMYRQEVWWP